MGSGSEQFRWPRGIAVDQSGSILVADSDMERIQKFDSNGNFLLAFQGPHNNEDGPFHPRAIDVNTSTGTIYVAAAYAHRIDMFDANGNYISSWGHHEKNGAIFNEPKGIAVDPSNGALYIGDTHNHLIKKFNNDGTFIKEFGSTPFVVRDETSIHYPAPIQVDSGSNVWALNEGIYYRDEPFWGSDKFVRQFDSDGNYISGFSHPDFWAGMRGLAIQPDNKEIYITNTPLHKVMKFDSFGNLLLEFGSFGDGIAHFNKPAGIALDINNQFLYVIDSGNQRIQKFDLNGQYITSWGNAGISQGQFNFNEYSQVAVDSTGNIFVADSGNARIQIFNSAGDYLTEIGSYGWGTEKFAWPASLCIFNETLYVLDTGGNEVEIYCITNVYEDAEDGLINGWQVYDETPSGAQILNVFDEDRQSRVIQFTGSGIENGYQLGTDDRIKWQNSNQFVIEWSMKYSEDFRVYVNVMTTAGYRCIYYSPIENNKLGNGEYIHHGLGTNVIDNKWYTFVRDLQVDLEEAQPGINILEVNGFLIRGSGCVDDIKLRLDIPESYDTDGDGISDRDELIVYKTKPSVVDTDHDGIDDSSELDFWGENRWHLDYDDDGLHNLLDWDSDGDGVSDGVEIISGSDPSDSTDTPPTIYEDAEDGLINGWQVYDETPSGAQISNAFDEDRQSRVIQFTGSGIENGYQLGTDDRIKWQNSNQFVIEWSMKYSEDFRVYVNVMTTAGYRCIYYSPIENNKLGNGEYIHHGLGTNVIDNKWHTFVRDLQVDLEEAQPGINILEVNGFLIRGSGCVDDIKLRLDIPESYDTDGDGISDRDELIVYKTKPSVVDTDHDGIDDSSELDFWGENRWHLDYDDDGLHNLLDWDSDGDSVSDGVEIISGSDPSDSTDTPPTIYEDAEDGLINGWQVYDETPSGAQISNVFDEDRQSRVIQFTGSGIENGYQLGTDDRIKWQNPNQFVIEWSMKYSEDFRVYVNVMTTAGYRCIYYSPIENNKLGNGEYIHHGLGTNVIDNKWHTFVRDLQVDLEEAQPGINILEVNIFLIRGSGCVDDILLSCR